MKTDDKTNAMRILDYAGAEYISHGFNTKTALSGVELADKLGLPREVVYKTLVTVAASKKNYVFVIPIERELDLKRAAASVNEKSVSMIKQAELLPLTGYVHGGCSPIGMKKFFDTVIDISAESNDRIVFSAGKIGRQIETTLQELAKAIKFKTADITRG